MSRDVANLTERKNLYTPVYSVKEFVCLSVTNFDPNYLRTGKTEWAKAIHSKNFSTISLYFSALYTMCASSKNGEISFFRQSF